MAQNYYQYSKKHFEYQLKGILIRNKSGFMEDITEQYIAEGNDSWEHIYKISTKNRAVDIILFSSVDKRTSQVRDIGSDAVRVVLRWKTKNGMMYKHIAKHYRIKTLFQHLEQTILTTQQTIFNLKFNEFTQKIAI